MRPSFKFTILILASLAWGFACDPGAPKDDAVFKNFSYQGKDKFYDENELEVDEFYNPILQGFYPNPTITRKGENYFMTTATFGYFPGVPIFHSRDLINWEQIGHVLSRPSQLPLEGVDVNQGISAPCIRYNPHNDMFYVVTTLVGGANGGIFIVKTHDPLNEEWSEPIYLPEAEGNDPSLFFDGDGKAYLVCSDSPEGGKLYSGHRVIKLWKFDAEADKIVGEAEIVIDNVATAYGKSIWLESPRIFKKNDMYYIFCAEGGRGDWYSEVVFGSKDIMGPYVSSNDNPVLTQRRLTEPRDYEVTSAGCADITDTPEGTYYGVFSACRPYDGEFYNIGRETCLLPVVWSDDFPLFVGGTEPIQLKSKMPLGVANNVGVDNYIPNGNFRFEDNFAKEKLGVDWMMIRTPSEDFYSTSKHGLRLTKREAGIRDGGNPSFVGYRQKHASFEAEVTLRFNPKSQFDMAGLSCFQNEENNYLIGVTLSDEGGQIVVLEKTTEGKKEIVAQSSLPEHKEIGLKVDGNGGVYSFYYKLDGGEYHSIAEKQDGTMLSTENAGWFTGTVIGLYASSNNK